MCYEWDEGKRLANIAKHDVDFGEAASFDWSTAIEAKDSRFDYREERWVVLGFIGSRLHVLIYTKRGKNIRLISLRKANEREGEYYD